MADGNNMTDGQPTREMSTGGDIMKPLTPGAFGVMITTTDVDAGFGNIKPVTLQAPDGDKIFCEHHQLGILSVPTIPQDVPPGEAQAKP